MDELNKEFEGHKVHLSEVEHCELDSNIMSRRVGRISTNDSSADEINTLLNRLKSQEYKLVYWLLYQEHIEYIHSEFQYKAELYGNNIYLAHAVDDNILSIESGSIKESISGCSVEELKDLVTACTRYSHLRMDPKIDNYHVLALFDHWLQDGLMDRNNRKVALLHNRNQTLGFAVYTISQEALHINLFAVKNRSQQKGFGAQLIHFLINKARAHNCSAVSVIGQRENTEAVNFYKSVGFSERYRYKIYHFWI